MSKDLQAIKYLNDTCINFLDRTKELYCTVTFTRKRAEILRDNIAEVDNALQRLKSIDNANPSEALECLEALEQDIKDRVILAEDRQLKLCAIIKQALLKAQELPEPFKTGVDIGVIKPKHYLKWEDLEFNHTPKMIDVKMSGNKYKLVVGYNVVGNNLAILRDGKKEYYFLECDKQFFNDLHLEVLEC